MKETVAEPYRDIDFSQAQRGAVIPPDPGKTKISIRLDNRVLDHFRSLVEKAGGGNYQTLINDALVSYIDQHSILDAVRQVIREEITTAGPRRSRTARSAVGPGARLVTSP
ncbi:MAG TPA: BrnA antitoxin family protein [Thermoanaerobaculia bacterium]|nr:BrnA antitoxin family protein [Thermoanaerobaculia bacterium]